MSASAERTAALPRYKRAAFAILPALAMLPVAEIALRVAVPDVEIRTPLARGGLLRPYVPGAEADLVGADFRVRYAINEFGFRDLRGRAVAREGDEHRPRILLLGDSFTEGYGVEQADTYASRLAQLGDYEVWNLGRMGASPLFYVVMAREYVPLLRPDVVVVQLFDNDLEENRYRNLPREPDGRVGAMPDAIRPPTGVRGRLADAWRGLALVQAFDRLERRIDGRVVPRIFVHPGSRVAPNRAGAPAAAEQHFPWYDPARAAEWEPRLAEQEVLVRQLVRELRASDTYVLVAYVPYAPALVAGDPDASRARNPHERRIAALARELGVPLLDGIELFAARGRNPGDYYFPHDQHWNAEGHALFADALEPALPGMSIDEGPP